MSPQMNIATQTHPLLARIYSLLARRAVPQNEIQRQQTAMRQRYQHHHRQTTFYPHLHAEPLSLLHADGGWQRVFGGQVI